MATKKLQDDTGWERNELLSLIHFINTQSTALTKLGIVRTAIFRICTNFEKFALRDEYAINAACRRLIHALRDHDIAELTLREWTRTICALAMPSSTQQFEFGAAEREQSDIQFEIGNHEANGQPSRSLSDVSTRNAALIANSGLLEQICKLAESKTNNPLTVTKDDIEAQRLESIYDTVACLKQIVNHDWGVLSPSAHRCFKNLGSAALHIAMDYCPQSSNAPISKNHILTMKSATMTYLKAFEKTLFYEENVEVFCLETLELMCRVVRLYLLNNLKVIVSSALLDLLVLTPFTDYYELPEVLLLAAIECGRHVVKMPNVAPLASPEENVDFSVHLVQEAMLLAAGVERSDEISRLLEGAPHVVQGCITALSMQKLERPNTKLLLQLALIVAHAPAGLRLTQRFGDLYQHLNDQCLVTRRLQKQLVNKLFNLRRRITLSPIFVAIAAVEVNQPGKTSAGAIVQKLIRINPKTGIMNLGVVDLIRKLACFLTQADIQCLTRIMFTSTIPRAIYKKKVKLSTMSNMLHALHLIMRRGQCVVSASAFMERTNSRRPEKSKHRRSLEAPKWLCRQEFTDYTLEKYCMMLLNLATKAQSTAQAWLIPAPAFPPITRIFLECIQSPEAMLPELTLFFRQYNLFFDDDTRSFLKAFNAADSKFEDCLSVTISRRVACSTAIRFLEVLTDKLEEEGADSLTMDAYDGLFSLMDSPLAFTPELTAAMTKFVMHISNCAIAFKCQEFGCEFHDRAARMLRIAQNPLLGDALKKRVRSAIHPMLRELCDFFSSSTLPAGDFDWLDVLSESVKTHSKFKPLLALKLLFEHIAEDILHRAQVPESRCHAAEFFVMQVHPLLTAYDIDVLDKLIDDSLEERVIAVRLRQLIEDFFMLMIDTRARTKIEMCNVPDMFGQIAYEFLMSSHALPYDTLRDPSTIGEDGIVLADAVAPSLFRFGSQIVKHLRDAPKGTSDLFLEPIKTLITQTPEKISNSKQALAILATARTLLEHFAETETPAIHQLLLTCVDSVLANPSLPDICATLYPLSMQFSDRFGASMLRARRKASNTAFLDSEDDPIKAMLLLFTQFSTPGIHSKIIKAIAKCLPEWLDFKEQLQYFQLDNVHPPASDDNGRFVWQLRILVNIFSYLDEIASRLNGHTEESQYYSDDDHLKDQLSKIYFQFPVGNKNTSTPATESRPESSNSKLCTYASSEKQFVSQHWYNCHTCGMTDTVGVCSVCAINCHRGHDISYSKKGPFFCDCGDKGATVCKALRNAEYDASAAALMSVVRGATGAVTADSPSRRSELKKTHPFEDIDVLPSEEEEISKALVDICNILDSKHEQIWEFCSLMQESSEARWNVLDRTGERASLQDTISKRKCIKQKFMKDLDIDNLEFFDLRNDAPIAEVSNQLQPRDLLGVVELENGRCVIVLLSRSGNLLTFAHPSSNGTVIRTSSDDDSNSWRIETEQLTFSAKRVSCTKQRCVVSSASSCLLLRFGTNGEILERHMILHTEATSMPSSNPLVKAVWSDNDIPLLALAGIQIVRVFNVAVDLEDSVEELVLPVGNVVDLFMDARDEQIIYFAILSSHGHLYIHQMNADNLDSPSEGSSYFLTNNIILPQATAGVALHFSRTTDLMFLSNTTSTFYAHVPVKGLQNLSLDKFALLDLPSPLTSLTYFQESNGIISAIDSKNLRKIALLHIGIENFHIQVEDLPYSIISHVIWTKPTCDGFFALHFLHDSSKKCTVFESDWCHEFDFWIPNVPRDVQAIVINDESLENNSKPAPLEDMVTIFEHAQPITRVEYECAALAMYYNTSILSARLNCVGAQPVVFLHFTLPDGTASIKMKVNEWDQVVRAIRFELDEGRHPASISVLDRNISTKGHTKRFYDVILTRKQSLTLGKTLNVRLTQCETGGETAIISIQLFGVPRWEFGWSTTTRSIGTLLTLPQEMLLRLLDFLANAIGAGLRSSDKALPHAMASRLSSARISHPLVQASAIPLLRMTSDSLMAYYFALDSNWVSDLHKFVHCPLITNSDDEANLDCSFFAHRNAIPAELIEPYVNAGKLMLATRAAEFEKFVKLHFKSLFAFLQFLQQQLFLAQDDGLQLIEFFVLVSLHVIATPRGESEDAMRLLISLLISKKSTNIAFTIRSFFERFVSSFVAVAKSDLSIAKSSNDDAQFFMVNAGALPFYKISKFVGSDMDLVLIKRRMGTVIEATNIAREERLLFDECGDAGWIVRLLNALIDLISGAAKTGKTEGSNPLRSIDIDQQTVGPCSPQINALVEMAAVLLSQLPVGVACTIAERIVNCCNFNVLIFSGDYTCRRLSYFLRILVCWMLNTEHSRERQESSPVASAGRADMTPRETRDAETVEPEDDEDHPDEEESDNEESDVCDLPTDKISELQRISAKLIEAGAAACCFGVLRLAINHWKEFKPPSRQRTHLHVTKSSFLKAETGTWTPPRFWEEKDAYKLKVTEIALRLPLLLHRFGQVTLEKRWNDCLCELFFTCDVMQIRRATRKLLIAVNGDSIEKYRTAKSKYIINCHMKDLGQKFSAINSTSFNHVQLSAMVDVVTRMVTEIRLQPAVWRELALEKLRWLLAMATRLPETLSHTIVELLVVAVRDIPDSDNESTEENTIQTSSDAEKVIEHPMADNLVENEENLALFKKLLERYLLGRDLQMRWTMHGMLRSTMQLAKRPNQQILMSILLQELWPLARNLGKVGKQTADLIAVYAPRLLNNDQLTAIVEAELETIKDAKIRLDKSGSTETVREFSRVGLSWREAFITDLSPCTICSERQESKQTMKLSVIKQDSRYTSNAHLIKLAGHYEISKITIKLSEVKRAKTVKRVVLYYCQKIVDSAIELKTNRDQWERAAETYVKPTDTEIILSLPIPLSTSSLVIHFAELEETRSGSELHCPRCTSIVQPNPGVCDNCGENVYQCVKCRQINYDERQPFLCPSCGFCKYARMEFIVTCRILAAVPPITCNAEYQQTHEQLGKVLLSMEHLRSNLVAGKALIETIYFKKRLGIQLHSSTYEHAKTLMQSVPQLNSAQPGITVLSQCINQCRQYHDELCMLTLQVIAYREELRAYEHRTGQVKHTQLLHPGFYSTCLNCIGCVTASVLHSVGIINSAVGGHKEIHGRLLAHPVLWQELRELRQDFLMLAPEVDNLFSFLIFDNEKATTKLCQYVNAGKIHPSALVWALLNVKDKYWEMKLNALLKLAMTFQEDEGVNLSLLTVCVQLAAANHEEDDDEGLKDESDETLDPTALTLNDSDLIHAGETEVEVWDEPASSDDPEAALEEDFLASLSSRQLPDLTALNHMSYSRLRRMLRRWDARQHIAKAVVAQRSTFADFLRPCEEEKKVYIAEGQDTIEIRDMKAHQVARLVFEEHKDWFWKCVFSPFISLRSSACDFFAHLCRMHISPTEVQSCMLEGLHVCLKASPVTTDQFYRFLHTIVEKNAGTKTSFIKSGLHKELISIIEMECDLIYKQEINEDCLVDNNFGLHLKHVTELLAKLIHPPNGAQNAECLAELRSGDLCQPLFMSLVFLKRVIVKRTRYTDYAMKIIEIILQTITGNQQADVLKVAVSALKLNVDFYTKAKILDCVHQIIIPAQTEDDSFTIQICKDTLQEDYLQGRMTGNPYKSTDPGMGPLMRDIKNKICRDSELVTLVDEENALELLVNGQIISLALPVKAVYEKVWKRAGREVQSEPMVIVYRLRGLLGDATEPFVSVLPEDEAEKERKDDPAVVSFVHCEGVERAIDLLEYTTLTAPGRMLLAQFKRVIDICLDTEIGRLATIKYDGVEKLLKVCLMCLQEAGVIASQRSTRTRTSSQNSGQDQDEIPDDVEAISAYSRAKADCVEAVGIAEQYLDMANALLTDPKMHAHLPGISFNTMKTLIELLLVPAMPFESRRSNNTNSMMNANLSSQMRLKICSVVANGAIGNDETKDLVVESIIEGSDWEYIETNLGASHLIDTSFCSVYVMCSIIHELKKTPQAQRIKDELLKRGLLKQATECLLRNHPPLYSTIESAEWKDYLSRPSLRIVLMLLAGMAKGHEGSQNAIALNSLHILHRLEQVTTVEGLGLLAESVVDALKENNEVAAKIEAVRQETKLKKRQMAMQMRTKQLNKMGMVLGKAGEVKVIPRSIANEPTLDTPSTDGPLQTCCICRESILQGTRVACVYAFAALGESRTPPSYYTVSKLVFVHAECHATAIRRVTGRGGQDEWSKAALHNAGGLCNVLLPVAVGEPASDDWGAAIARADTDLCQAVTTGLSFTRKSIYNDIAQIVNRLIEQKSFSTLSKGGGRESNTQYLCILYLLALTMEESPNDLPNDSAEAVTLSSLFTSETHSNWNEERLDVLSAAFRNRLELANTQATAPTWDAIRGCCLTWAFVQLMFDKSLKFGEEDRIEWIKSNFVAMLKGASEVLQKFDNTLMVCESFIHFCEAMELNVDDTRWDDVRQL